MFGEEQIFLDKAKKVSVDEAHKRTIDFNIGKYDAAVNKGLNHLEDVDSLKDTAHAIKKHTIDNLGHYLNEWEKKATSNGIKVLWAKDSKQAKTYIEQICREKKAHSIVKSKSMVTEEIHLNPYLRDRGYEVLETDLGEFIVDLLGQKPYHIVTPAMHLSRKEIAQLFHQKFGTKIDATAEELTLKAREVLREKFYRADVGITGGNFLIADTGSLVLTENEGNARLSFSLPKTHIAVVGIEKMVPSIHYMDVFWHLLSTHGTGQLMTVYKTVISKPEKLSDGTTRDVYVILLDNNRTALFQNKELRQALYCIRCGACLNACPVYRSVGGHTYGSTYSGPIGAVVAPHIESATYKHLPYASTLCGKCSEVCPVKIPIDSLLWLNRTIFSNQSSSSKSQRLFWRIWAWSMKNITWTNLPSGKMKSWLVSLFYKKKDIPTFAASTFRKIFRQKYK